MHNSIHITFVRHGESTSNRNQRWQGQGNSELSELGRDQAAALGQRLAKREFDLVVASDLTRAVDTARATGFAFEQLKEFREFDVGRWEGLTREEVEARYPEEMDRLKQGEDIPLGGGESFGVFSERIDQALARLYARLEPGNRVLVVCHGGVIGTAISGLLGLRGRRRFPLARVSNTAISELEVSSADGCVQHARLRVFNDARHVAAVSPWPSIEPNLGCLALICDARPDVGYGDFEAHYEAEPTLQQLDGGASLGGPIEARFSELVSALSARHPERRVSLAASSALVRAWAESTIWPERSEQAQLGQPRVGDLSHVGAGHEGGLMLLDYGVSLD